jgi:cellulose synthase/poly-beta-1,6-N-acetylglucosamine synthase-like glycosyltransferase
MAAIAIGLIYLLLGTLYVLWAMYILRGWRHFVHKSHDVAPIESVQSISIVVAFRNEEQQLPTLLHHLTALRYPSEKFEIILVDDHSNDAGVAVINQWIEKFSSKKIKLISTEKAGKKSAQYTGIQAATFKIIACTDADCVPSQDWLYACNNAFINSDVQLAFGSVVMQGSNWQEVEFCSLMGSTMAMLSLQWPVMGNGANMVVKKSAYLEAFPDARGSDLASGDDVFLLHEIASNGGRITTLHGQSSLVKTATQPTMSEFFWQRIRWAGKASAYQSKYALLVAALIFFMNLAVLFSVLILPWSQNSWPLLLLGFVKFIVDYCLLRSFCRYYQVKFAIQTFVFLEIFNLIYIPGVALLSQILKYPWKGRSYTSSLKKARTSRPEGA